MSRRIAVMQPYLYPYPGYFQLFAVADCFVIYDCVQFNRRGRVHRAELSSTDTQPRWLTLPLTRQPQDVRICDLAFARNARTRFDTSLAACPWLSASNAAAEAVLAHLTAPLNDVVDFLEHGLRLAAGLLGRGIPVVRSSSLALPAQLRGQDRVLSIVQRLQGTDYVNPSGGRALYDPDRFARAGVGLAFLAPYAGVHRHTLPMLFEHGAGAFRDNVLHGLQVLPA